MTRKLATLAKKYQSVIVLVGHMNKATGNKVAYWGMGSIDFFAVARSKMEQAKSLLRKLAETNNAIQSNEIFNLADEQGISKRTLENAKKELGVCGDYAQQSIK